MEVITVTFFNAVTIVDVLTASNNGVNFVEAQTTGLKITAGQRTMSSLIVGLTGQTLVWPVIFGCLSLNAFCSITL